ncbi:MAG: septum formation initiator family protein [Nitrospinaceae bacterium]|jgi:cell division protein FtsL|nr:septum formation initiator family protein [Nitrospinaceae bacterium]MBT3434372.1 septum formation initiator family protein [Nitrospinaceae bacterium]MBT3822843.1 septum formation initiator family protein [Nitrospinaceae bacterium]MBT4431421.1 septum formation initiator family protein [Nitrospinaceae bacterium]MBT5366485.1 septum formation initiator family protein [Nitrospinaceae bacterium]
MWRLRRSGRGPKGSKKAWAGWEFQIPVSRVAMIVGSLAVSALALAWPHLEMVEIGYEVARLKNERDVMAQERRVLRVEIAALRQLDRVETIARNKLGMVFPRPNQIVYVMVPARHP